MLPEKRRAVDAWEPAFPLILAEWHDAPAMLKMVRLAEHIEWAEKHNALPEVAAFLRGLQEDSPVAGQAPSAEPAVLEPAFVSAAR
jgi:hypothetical protein